MQFEEQQLNAAIVEILNDMTQDWDLDYEGDLGPETKLVEHLGFSSVDIIHLVVAIEEHFNVRKIGFDQVLMRDGRYVSDLSVGQVVSFLATKFNNGIAI